MSIGPETINLIAASILSALIIGAAARILYVPVIRNQLENIEKRFDAVDQRFTESEKRMDQRFSESEKRMDQRFDAVDQRFDAVDQRFAESEKRMEQRFDAVDQRFDAVEKRLDGVERRLDVLDTRLWHFVMSGQRNHQPAPEESES